MTHAFDLQAFVDEITNELIVNAPAMVQEMVMSSEPLQVDVLAYQVEIRSGLQSILDGSGTVEDLEKALKARKTQIVASAPDHSYTVERLVSKVNQRVLDQARVLPAPPSLQRRQASHG